MQPGVTIPAQTLQGQRKAKTRSNNGKIIGSMLLVLAALALMLPLAALGAAAVYVNQIQMVLPGISVGLVDVSNLPLTQAATAIDNYWNNSAHLLVLNEDYQWTVTPPNIGLWIDPGQTAQLAYEVGRGQAGVQELLQLAQGQRFDIQPLVSFNEAYAREVFSDLAAKIEIPPTDARLVQDASRRWLAEPGLDGWGLDVEAAVAMIKADPQVILQAGYLQLPMRAIPAAVSDLSPQLAQIATYYEIPIHLRAWDPITDELLTWSLPQDLVVGWVRLDDPYGEPSIQVDADQFEDYLAEWQTSIGNREIDFKDPDTALEEVWMQGGVYTIFLRHKATEYTVQYGDNLVGIGFKVGMPYWKIQEANPGSSIYGVHYGQVLTIPSKNEMLPYPPVLGKRILISITEQHLWVYEDFALKSEHVISSGMSDSPTLPGVFQIQTHEINAYASNWDLWMPHFMGIYEAVPGFMNGIHGLPVLSSGVRLWANVLGHPASYGCIILDLQAGEELYNWAENGVVVEILP